jgi:hypothetical protein
MSELFTLLKIVQVRVSEATACLYKYLSPFLYMAEISLQGFTTVLAFFWLIYWIQLKRQE